MGRSLYTGPGTARNTETNWTAIPTQTMTVAPNILAFVPCQKHNASCNLDPI